MTSQQFADLEAAIQRFIDKGLNEDGYTGYFGEDTVHLAAMAAGAVIDAAQEVQRYIVREGLS